MSNEILDKRMRDLPVINASLSVQSVGFNRFGEDCLGILITPWFMDLMLLPGPKIAIGVRNNPAQK